MSTIVSSVATQSFEMIGSKLAGFMIEKIKDWPTNKKEADEYFQSVKMAAENELRVGEDTFQSSLKLLMNARRTDEYNVLERLRKRIEKIRFDIQKSLSDVSQAVISDDKAFRALSMIYLTLQYEIFIISNEATKLNDDIEFGNDIKPRLDTIRVGLANLEEIARLRSQAMNDPSTAEQLFNSLKQTRKHWVELIDRIANSSLSQANELLVGIVLKKPKLFGKKKYLESLAEIIWNYANSMEVQKQALPTVIQDIKIKNPEIEMTDEDLEAAVKLLIENNRAYNITVEDNIKQIEFIKSDQTKTCGNCSRTPKMYEDFRECVVSNSYVCDNCISFFGKCKICKSSYKQKHPLVSGGK